MNIQQRIDKYIIQDGGEAKISTVDGVNGVTFKADKFIPWDVLGFNKSKGFFDIREHPTRKDSVGANYKAKRLIVDDKPQRTVWALVDTNEVLNTLVFGDWGNVLKAQAAINKLVENAEKTPLADALNETRLNSMQAHNIIVDSGFTHIGYNTVRQAARRGKIKGVTGKGRGQTFPQREFLHWLDGKLK